MDIYLRHHRFGLQTAVLLGLASFASSCPPPGSVMEFPEGFLRNGSDPVVLSKRWAAIIPGDGSNIANLGSDNHNCRQWPNGLIMVCMDPGLSQELRDDYEYSILQGMDQWYAAGLTADSFRLRFLNLEACAQAGVVGPKKDFLWVVKQEPGSTPAATLGNADKGSILEAQDRDFFIQYAPGKPDSQAENRARTFAHELGHVFGLLHEQQNPAAWTTEHGGVAHVGMFDFKCENLNDYDACRSDTLHMFSNDIEKTDARMNAMCQSTLGAYQNACKRDLGEVGRVMAHVGWLPQPGGGNYVQFARHVDLKSAMIYPSAAGARPGKGTNDEPVYVYTLVEEIGLDPFNPTLITGPTNQNDVNYWPPSGADVLGAVIISSNAPAGNQPSPYFTSASPFHDIWENSAGISASCPTFSKASKRRSLSLKTERHALMRRQGAEARDNIKLRMLAPGGIFGFTSS